MCAVVTNLWCKARKILVPELFHDWRAQARYVRVFPELYVPSAGLIGHSLDRPAEWFTSRRAHWWNHLDAVDHETRIAGVLACVILLEALTDSILSS